MTAPKPLVEHLIDALAARGVRRVFGVPGGGSSLDVIAAARSRGIDFVLARQETSAAIMGLATARIEGTPGVALTTVGPGLASAANGLACATLDRAPLLLVSDGLAAEAARFVTHQALDQRALSAPLVKGHARLEVGEDAGVLDRLLDLAMTPPHGAVHVELTGEAARRPVERAAAPAAAAPSAPAPAAIEAARALLACAMRPVLVVGLEACTASAAAAARRLAAVLDCPVLTTYQAKGVIPDTDPRAVGLFTGGTLEAPLVEAADLVVLFGVDPVELIPQPWAYRAPVLELGLTPRQRYYATPAAALYGPLDRCLAELAPRAVPRGWPADTAAAHRRRARARLACAAGDGVSPQRIVEIAQDAAPSDARPRVTVDAGAHMFSATAFWQCSAPNDLLISNGLATMGFALPAAIAASLADRSRPVVALTGDGGLAMCLGELLTAAERRARVVVVVFNDGALSLIDIKQQARGLPTEGVRWGRADFAGAAAAFGFAVWRARSEREYADAIVSALRTDAPCLIDVRVDPVGYREQLKALRG
ncbi:MAG: thiamine pyrophosphate-binding protein [Burkholderiales bacterium]|nr:thiamine pyrophosphate-binding protein [Burkholderiales bacterium]